MIKNQISFFIKDTYSGSIGDPLSLNLYTYCANNPLVYYDPTGNTYVPLEVPTQYVNKHYNSVKAYDLAWRKQTDKDFAKRVELGEIIDRKMRSDKSAENIVLGSSQLEHEAMLFLQDQVYVHGQQALEVTVERLLENKRLYLKTGDKIYLTLFKNAYVDYVASKNTYSELGFEIKNGFVKDENYYETLYNIYYREDNFKEWLLLERNLQTLFAEAQAHINAGIQLGSMGVLQNMASSYTNVNNNLNSLDIKNSRLDKMEYNAYTGNVNKPTNSVPQTSFKYKLNKDFRGIFKLKETGNLDAGVGNGANKNFASKELLDSHYEKHAVKNNEFRGAYKNADEYMQGARDVMSNGTKVEYQYKGETRTGYVKFMGNSSKGEAKFEFVGTNASGDVTTYHVKRGEDLWKLLNNNKHDKTINPMK